MKKIAFYSLLLAAAAFTACKKEEPQPQPEEQVPAPETATVKIRFDHVVGSTALEFDKPYRNALGDTFTVNKFIYYISNVVLHKADNSVYTVPESYYLIDHQKPDSRSITLSNIPPGEYKSVTMMLGVDSLRNVSGAQSGALSVSNNMFWSWNSGYIFLKLEGQAPKAPTGSLTFHIGGFKGNYRTQRSMNIPFGSNIGLAKNETLQLSMQVDVNEMFESPTKLDFSTFYYQMSPGPNARVIADNYADMISFKSYVK